MTIDAVVERKVERVADGRNLLNNLNLINAATWETSDEVFKAWQDGAAIEGVNTANLAVYGLEDDEAVFELLGREGNPFMDESLRKDAYNGILQNEFFVPQGAMKDEIKAAKPLVTTIRYSELTIKTDGCESTNFGYVIFDGKNTDGDKKLFNAVYGTDNLGLGKRIYLLRKDVVEVQLKNRKDDLIVRACYFYDYQSFIANDWFIGGFSSAVRGVRLDSVAKGNELKEAGVAPQETQQQAQQ